LGAGLALAAPAFAQTAAEHAQTALPFDPDVATRQWLDTMDPAARARSDSYFEGGYWIGFVGPILSIIVAFLFLQLGFANRLRNWLKGTVKFYIVVTFGFALLYSLLGAVFSFPWDYWVQFVREHDYGLSTQDFSHWFTEYLQGAGIGLIIGAFAITIL